MHIRAATMDDALVLLAWRNDPLTRSMSKNSDSVGLCDHIAWLEKRLSRSEPNLYVAERDGVAVGTIRIDGDQVSYTTAPEARGRGVATAMLEWAFETFGQLTAEIKSSNPASIAAATNAGHRVALLDHQ